MIILFVVFCLGCVSAVANQTSNEELVCPPNVIQCICNRTDDQLANLTTTIKSCFNNASKTCQLYAECKTCNEGLGRCLTCPLGKYGQWCDQDCTCTNGAACDLNGKCQQINLENNFQDIFNKSMSNIKKGFSMYRFPRRAETPTSTSCPALKDPENGFLQLNIDFSAMQKIQANSSAIPVRTQVKYKCKNGYRLTTSESTLTCLPDGQWDHKIPQCITECGKPNVPMSSYILNGAPITIDRWPWQAGLYTYETKSVFCGGSVLNERWVLTAAHCITIRLENGSVQRLNHRHYGVFFGHSTSQLDLIRKGTITRKVWSVIYHENYNADTSDSDIALINLGAALTFNNAIHPICLPSIKSDPSDITNSAGIVAGWGMENPSIENISLELRYIHVKIVSNNVCKNTSANENGFKFPITQNMFCAGGDKEGSGTCNGDAGGSLCVIAGPRDEEVFQIEGIVSFGRYSGCGAPGQYDGYTKVRNFLDWIQSYISQ